MPCSLPIFAESLSHFHINIKTVEGSVCLFSIAAVYTLWVVVYRLVFHPLAKFPGPKLAALTKWYEAYYDILKSPGGQFAAEISRMHDRYGPIVRINPNEIHIRDASWFDTLYASNPTHRDKYPPAAAMVGLPLGSHGTIDHDIHRKRRAANAPLFSQRAIMSEGENLIREHVKELADIFEATHRDKSFICLDTTLLALTTDTLYAYAYGKNSGLLQDREAAAKWRHNMESVARATPFFKQFPWIMTIVNLIPPALVKKLLPDVAMVLSVHTDMAAMVSQHRATRSKQTSEERIITETKIGTAKPRTLFHSIERSRLPPHEKSAARLQQEGATILFAGSETTARLLCHTIFHLLDNPEIIQKLRDEVLKASGICKRIPDLKTLRTLPWLTACVRESLRLRAATTSRLPLMSNTELVYQEWVIPAKIPVSMSHPDILHDPTIYQNPLCFDPQRWFNPSEQANRSFVAFGKGTRMCQAMEFAYAEMYITLATLFCRFDLELYDTYRERDIDYVRDFFLGAPTPESLGVRVKVVATTDSIVL